MRGCCFSNSAPSKKKVTKNSVVNDTDDLFQFFKASREETRICLFSTLRYIYLRLKSRLVMLELSQTVLRTISSSLVRRLDEQGQRNRRKYEDKDEEKFRVVKRCWRTIVRRWDSQWISSVRLEPSRIRTSFTQWFLRLLWNSCEEKEIIFRADYIVVKKLSTLMAQCPWYFLLNIQKRYSGHRRETQNVAITEYKEVNAKQA